MTTMLDHEDDGAPVRLTEEERVDQWRGECLDRMGFTEHEVVLLLLSDVNLGDVRDLISRGCSTELAVRIVT